MRGGWFLGKGWNMTENQLLAEVAPLIKTGWEFCDSKWQNAECEAIAIQTISACHHNLKEHGDAFSWLGTNATRGRAACGTDNKAGLSRLINDGSLIQEPYTGPLAPPSDTATDEKGNPLVLRCTESLLHYAASILKSKKRAS